MDSAWIWNREAIVFSVRGAGRDILDELISRLRQDDWSEDDIFAVEMAGEEAITNAVHHGNRYDPTKKVRLRFQVAPDRVLMIVSDEGDGFDPKAVPDPCAEENLDRPNGRGVHLIRNFMTRICYNESGNQVTMELDRSR